MPWSLVEVQLFFVIFILRLKLIELNLRKKDNAKDDFCKKNDLDACLAKKELIAGEDEAVKANLDPHDNDAHEKDEFDKTNYLASCINSKKPCIGEDDGYLIDSTNIKKRQCER